jgi:hypothetical protein
MLCLPSKYVEFSDRFIHAPSDLNYERDTCRWNCSTQIVNLKLVTITLPWQPWSVPIKGTWACPCHFPPSTHIFFPHHEAWLYIVGRLCMQPLSLFLFLSLSLSLSFSLSATFPKSVLPGASQPRRKQGRKEVRKKRGGGNLGSTFIQTEIRCQFVCLLSHPLSHTPSQLKWN